MPAPHHIAIVGRHFDHRAGLGTYSRGLVSHLPPSAEYRYTLFVDQPLAYRPPSHVEVRVIPQKERRLNPRERLFMWEQVEVRQAVRAARPDVVHWLHPAASLRRAIKPTVITVCDVIPWTSPGYLPSKSTKLYAAAEKRAVKSADHVIAISEFSKSEVTTHFGVAAEKITVTYLAPDEYLIPGESRVPGKYVLFLGGSERRKNPLRVIRGFLAADIPADVKLVIAGTIRKSFIDEDVNGALEGLSPAERARIVTLGKVSDEELAALYAHAVCFAFPSLSEGFGLPVLEAMGHGTPVLTSRASSLPEVAGEAALLVNPESTTELAVGIERLVTDGKLCESLRAAGKNQLKRFTWPQTASQTVAVYQKLLEGTRG